MLKLRRIRAGAYQIHTAELGTYTFGREGDARTFIHGWNMALAAVAKHQEQTT